MTGAAVRAESDRDGSWPIDNLATETREIWQIEKERFVALEANGRRLDLAIDDIDGATPRAVTTCNNELTNNCSRLFPTTFKYCPWCRSDLDPQRDAESWSFPSGDLDGRRNLKRRLDLLSPQPGSDGAEAVPLPEEGNNWVFAAGSKPTRLLAVSKSDGVAWLWSRTRARWTRCEVRLPPPSTGEAFGIVSADEGFWMSTDSGLALLSFVGSSQTPIVHLDSGAPCIGAPYRISEGVAIAPIRSPSGVALERVTIGSQRNKREILDAGANALVGALATPIRLQTQDVVWPGKHGFLGALIDRPLSGPTTIEPRWCAWPPNIVGVPHLGGTVVMGAIWLPCIKDGEGGLLRRRYRRVDPRTDSTRWDERGDYGHVVGAGGILYRNGERVDEPWDREATFSFGTTAGVLPLISFNDVYAALVTDDSDAWSSVLNDDGRTFSAELWLSEPFHPGRRLMPGFNVRRPSDVQVFVYAQSLYVYDKPENRMWRFQCRV